MEKVNKILCVIIAILSILLGIVTYQLIKEKRYVDDNLAEIFYLRKELGEWQNKVIQNQTDNEVEINPVD